MTIKLNIQFEKLKQSVKNTIENVVNENHLELSTTTLENLVIHLSLCVSRELNGSYIATSESQSYNAMSHEFHIYSQEIIHRLEDKFDITIDPNQVNYVTMYLAGLNLLDMDFNTEFDLCDHELTSIIDESLGQIKDELHLDLKGNHEFYDRMTLHFYPALDRLQYDRQLTTNPLTDKIQTQYTKEYQCATIFNDVVEKYYHKSFNEHELAYIALHFGTAVTK